MNVIEIKPNGFCNGVKRAIEIVDEAIKNPNTPRPIYMFGYLVHNKIIVEKYKNDITIITTDYDEALENIQTGSVIFTAHGVKPSLIDKAKNKGLYIINTTCPNVSKIQNMIISKLNDKYNVIVIGGEKHPEVLSYLGISPNVHMYKKGFLPKGKAFVVNQTTLIYDDVLKIYDDIKVENPESEIALEVCNATKVRQQAIKENYQNVDAIIVVGDNMSNNVESLYQVALSFKPSFKIENASDLNKIDLSTYVTIGVTAGASTPPDVLNEVINKIKEMN